MPVNPAALVSASNAATNLAALAAGIREQVELIGDMPEALPVLLHALQVLGQADKKSGKALLLARATRLAARDTREGDSLVNALERNLRQLAAFDPKFPGEIAKSSAALAELELATTVLVQHQTNQQQLWLPHMHHVCVLLGITSGTQEATRADITRALKEAVDPGAYSDMHRLLDRLDDH